MLGKELPGREWHSSDALGSLSSWFKYHWAYLDELGRRVASQNKKEKKVILDLNPADTTECDSMGIDLLDGPQYMRPWCKEYAQARGGHTMYWKALYPLCSRSDTIHFAPVDCPDPYPQNEYSLQMSPSFIVFPNDWDMRQCILHSSISLRYPKCCYEDEN